MTSDLLPMSLHDPIPAWTSSRSFDVVVIGGGIAGLSFVLRLPETWSVALVTKGILGESNTRYAQGGLAAAVGPQDAPDLHFADTLAAGAGLCDPETVHALVEGGPHAVAWLLAQGTQFDKDNDALALGLEAAHSRHRVLHAGGDATGAEIERSLVHQVTSRDHVTLFEQAFAIDLVKDTIETDRIAGVTVLIHGESEPTLFRAPVTVLANGGAGQIWAVSSNPAGATGDGASMALRAGAEVADLEFTQFHPTVFTVEGAEPFLVSEAVRGEGAFLRNAAGERFMSELHPLAELAPRDVVARAVQHQMALDGSNAVSLDLSHLDPGEVRNRFPTIAAHLKRYGLDLATDLIPVAPAAHYFIGGIVAGSDGTTSLPGLLAIGEVSCTGVHGANRLASNSLLEGLVFGLRAADRLAAMPFPHTAPPADPPAFDLAPATSDLSAQKHQVQRIMSDAVAVVRSETSLLAARQALRKLAQESVADLSIPALELRNMLLLATEIVESALRREESRGAHFRSDFPEPVPALEGHHQVILPGGQRAFRVLHPAPTGAGIAH